MPEDDEINVGIDLDKDGEPDLELQLSGKGKFWQGILVGVPIGMGITTLVYLGFA